MRKSKVKVYEIELFEDKRRQNFVSSLTCGIDSPAESEHISKNIYYIGNLSCVDRSVAWIRHWF